MWYGGFGSGCGSWPVGWHNLLVFLLVITTIFVFIGHDGGRARGAEIGVD